MVKGFKVKTYPSVLLSAVLALIANMGIHHQALANGIDDGQIALSRGDESGAIRLWTPLAVAGNSEAQYRLGMMYVLGRGIIADESMGVRWLQLAAEQQHDGASLMLARLFLDPNKKIYNSDTGLSYLRTAAERGVVEAERELALLYRKGGIISQDFNEALIWFKRAASKGDIEAEAGLGELYRYGYGVSQNYSRALMWYRLAAGTPTDNRPEQIKAAQAAKRARDEVSAIASQTERAEAERLAIACWEAKLTGCDEL